MGRRRGRVTGSARSRRPCPRLPPERPGDAATDLDDLEVAILALSLDDVAAQKAFAKAQELAYPVLSDPDGSVAGKFGVLGPGGRYARRVTFVLDPEGVVRHVDETVDVTRHGAILAGIVRGLQSERDD